MAQIRIQVEDYVEIETLGHFETYGGLICKILSFSSSKIPKSLSHSLILSYSPQITIRKLRMRRKKKRKKEKNKSLHPTSPSLKVHTPSLLPHHSLSLSLSYPRRDNDIPTLG